MNTVFSKPEGRMLKSECRMPNAERNPKPEARKREGLRTFPSTPPQRRKTHFGFRISEFIRISGIRISDFQTASALLAAFALLAGCSFAPKYDKPSVETPGAFKEMTPTEAKLTDGWKAAEPKDNAIRGNWWEMFQQPELNLLEAQVTVTNNQTLAAALQNFILAREVMKATRSEYFPTVTANPGATLSRSNLKTPTSAGAIGGNFGGSSAQQILSYSLPLDASWQPDFWGSIQNSVKANAL